MTRLEVLRKVADGEATKIKSGSQIYTLDRTTASAMLSLYNSLNPYNRIKFLRLDWLEAINVTWKILGRK